MLTDAVADYTWALILAITRRLGEGERIVRRGEWKGWAFDFMLGTSVRGKQLGIIGAGRIGRAVADRAVAFGMRIAVSSRSQVDWPEAEWMTFDRLLATSDIVSLHVPLTPGDATADRSARARADEAHRVSGEHDAGTGRGRGRARLGTARAADCGRCPRRLRARARGARRLAAARKRVLAPHLGSATRETRLAMADSAVRNVIAVLTGNTALTPIRRVRRLRFRLTANR